MKPARITLVADAMTFLMTSADRRIRKAVVRAQHGEPLSAASLSSSPLRLIRDVTDSVTNEPQLRAIRRTLTHPR